MATLNEHCTRLVYEQQNLFWSWVFFSVLALFDTLGEAKMRQYSNEIYAFGVFSTPVY